MSFDSRIALYKRIETLRGRPLVTYVTSSRQHAEGSIGGDSIAFLMDQVMALPKDATTVDLLVVSNGGDPNVAWRIMTLLRERVTHVSVLLPQAAYSAATLLALGADEIVMHPCANLGPVDPQISGVRKNANGEQTQIRFGSEDLAGFMGYVRDQVGLTDQDQVQAMFRLFCEEVGAVPVGVAARSTRLSTQLGTKLLQLHMREEPSKQKAAAIAQMLNKEFFHHGYPVGRNEAKEIGLNVIEPDAELEKLLWETWLTIESDLKCRTPFTLLSELEKSTIAQELLGPIPTVSGIPGNLPQQVLQQAYNQVLQNITVKQVDPVDYALEIALIESPRLAASFWIRGKIFATRRGPTDITVNDLKVFAGWEPKPETSFTHTHNESPKTIKKVSKKIPKGGV